MFSIDYLNLINNAVVEKKISKDTFQIIKKELLYKYLSVRYFKTIIARLDNFEHENVQENILTYYSKKQYYAMLFVAMCTPFVLLYKKLI